MSQSTIEPQEWRWVFIVSILLLFAISLPFIWAYIAALPSSYFTGVLVNPIDGASYQAKMYQGFTGSWLYHLAYTPEAHQGIFLFTFYLGMGHVARLLSIPPIQVFHAVRLIGSMLMFLAIYEFMADWTDDVNQRRIGWILAVIGAGFGWVALLFGVITPDILTLPEAFPLQAAYANPHFPMALAIGIWMAHVLAARALNSEAPAPSLLDGFTPGLAFGTIFLMSTSPFVLVPIGIGYAALCAWLWYRHRQIPRRALAWGGVVILFGLPLAAYNLWAVSNLNPVFQQWMAQNVTPSPPLWHYLVAFGPLLALAGVAVWRSRHLLQAYDVFLLGWLVTGVLLLYAPFSLQRRFSMGLIIPLSVYAARGLWRVVAPLISPRPERQQFAVLIVCAFFMPTTALAIALPLVGTVEPAARGYPYYLTADETAALDWIEQQTPPHSIILASPELSLFIPAWGRRVIYGHPYETLRAAQRERAVRDFFSGADCSVLEDEAADYVWIGRYEQRIAGDGEMCPVPGEVVYRSPGGEVTLYRVQD